MIEIIVEEGNERLDSFLMKSTEFSRSKVQKMVDSEEVLVNNKPSKNSYKVKIDDVITIDKLEDEVIDIKPVQMDLDIVYEDNDLLVVNKPKSLVVHPAVGNYNNTLVNGLMYHSKTLSKTNGLFRPGIVHRIDADTSGLLVVAKNDKAHELLSKQLEEKTTTRVYEALVHGVIKNDTGTIDAPIGRDLKDRKKMAVIATGKKAVTHFKVLERYEKATLLELRLETGRTHQIRVHMNYIEYPIVNDKVYGKRETVNNTGQCLHAKTLGFIHPTTNEYMEFTKETPKEFDEIKNKYKSV
jgi:23S rRNA pseudouridine1911/1915/1917 synthase